MNMETKAVKSWHNETIGRKVVDALIKNEFDSIYFSTAEEASDFIMQYVEPGIMVGFPGSMTIYNMGIQDKVKKAGGNVLDHGIPGLTIEERVALARKEMLSDFFFS